MLEIHKFVDSQNISIRSDKELLQWLSVENICKSVEIINPTRNYSYCCLLPKIAFLKAKEGKLMKSQIEFPFNKLSVNSVSFSIYNFISIKWESIIGNGIGFFLTGN